MPFVTFARWNCSSGVIDPWLNTIADFTFRVEHRAGKKHTNVDSLSRFAAAADADHEEPNCIWSLTSHDRKFCRRFLFLHTRNEVRHLQQQYDALREVPNWLDRGCGPSKLEKSVLTRLTKTYAGLLDHLYLSGGLLWYSHADEQLQMSSPLLCLPEVLWDDTIAIAHATGGHMAAESTLCRLRTSVFVAGCEDCQAKLGGPKDQRHMLVSPSSGFPFQKIHIDFLGPFPESLRSGARYLLTCRDAFSKWVEAFPFKKATAEATVRALEHDIFS